MSLISSILPLKKFLREMLLKELTGFSMWKAVDANIYSEKTPIM